MNDRKRNPFKVRLPSTNKEFWVTNISSIKDISIDDLRVRVPRGRSINLLNRRHYSFTEEQVMQSLENGSLKKKAYVLKVREIAPLIETKIIDIEKQPRALRKARNDVVIEQRQYEELDFEDESEAELAFAEAQADAEFTDKAPLLPVDNKYVNIGGFNLKTASDYFKGKK